MPDAGPVFEAIRTLLDANDVDYRVVEHGPTRTSEESAAARGEELKVGGKALVLKVDDDFGLYVLSAATKLDSGALRKQKGARKTRFANADELKELTGLVPGSVPPFGPPILNLPLHADPTLLKNDKIAFNAGSLETSIVMPLADWKRLAQPTVLTFSK